MSPPLWLRRFFILLAAPSAVDLPEEIPPLPSVLSFARKHQIPIEGFTAAAGPPGGPAGDTVTALITVRASGVMKQWITQLTIAIPTEKESADNPPRDFTFNATNGRTYRFAAGANLALDVRTAGPFIEGRNSPAKEKRARAFISPDFLGIGLDESCRAMLKLSENQRRESSGTIAGDAERPVSAEPVVLSEEQERVLIGYVPALGAFLQGIQDTPGLREILWDLIEKPSLWSIMKNRGRVDTNLSFTNDAVAAVEGRHRASPEAVLYRMSPAVSLNNKPALNCTLFVTAPRPPLLTTAGIIGIVATPPGSKHKRLDLRIVAASRVLGP